MNHRDRATLGIILDQLWETRVDRINGEGLNPRQRELLAAAMRITAGTPGPELPDPWPTTAHNWTSNDPERPTWPLTEHETGNWLGRWRIQSTDPNRITLITGGTDSRPPDVIDLGPATPLTPWQRLRRWARNRKGTP